MRSTNEIPPEERAMVQELIDETYDKFKNVVARWPHPRACAEQQQEGKPLARELGKIMPMAACCPARRR